MIMPNEVCIQTIQYYIHDNHNILLPPEPFRPPGAASSGGPESISSKLINLALVPGVGDKPPSLLSVLCSLSLGPVWG